MLFFIRAFSLYNQLKYLYATIKGGNIMSKKISIHLPTILISLLLVLSTTPVYGGDNPSGKPFKYLNSKIDDLENINGSLEGRLSQAEADLEALKERIEQHDGDIGHLYEFMNDLEEEIASIRDEIQPNGKKVAPGLYEVHTRVLWDVGWMRNDNELENGYFAYDQTPRTLVYAGNREILLSPLKGYGIPEVQEGATRKVRLYVHYGEQLDYPGTPTILIGDVEFNLPKIGGFYVDMGANWSNYVTYEEYQHVRHGNIQMYLKYPHLLPDRPYGVVYRIEAHFYDEFPQ